LFFFFTLKFQKLQHQHTPVSFRYFIVPNQSNQNHAVIKVIAYTDNQISSGVEFPPCITLLLKKKIQGKTSRRILLPKLPKWTRQHCTWATTFRPKPATLPGG